MERARISSPSLWRILGWGLAGLLLLLPLIAMQFTSEVNWTAFDFVVAAMIVGGTGLAFEAAVRRSADPSYRLAAAIALLTAFLLVWIDGAVGIIGDEHNPLNALYLTIVLAAAVAGAPVRGRPRPMSRVMACASLAICMMAVLAGLYGSDEPPGFVGLLIIHAAFAGAFAISAALFSVAGRSRA